MPKTKYTRTLKYIDENKVKRLLLPILPRGVSYQDFAALLDTDLVNFNEGMTYVGSDGASAELPTGEGQVGFADRLLGNLKAGRVGDRAALDGTLDIHVNLSQGEDNTRRVCYSCVGPRTETDNPDCTMMFFRYHSFNGHPWVIGVPIFMLMQGWQWDKTGAMGYAHAIHSGSECYRYVGVTRRDWLTRLSEHIRGIESGERKLFYNAWREFAGKDGVTFESEVCAVGWSFEKVMDWEEQYVDHYMAEGTSLNAIPGGFRGIRELHKLGLLAQRDATNLKAREKAINAYQKLNPRAGVPNQLIRDLWRDDSFAEKMICNRDDRLSVEQVREIRRLAMWDVPVEIITQKVSARNLRQVQNVLSDQTYSRIH